MVVVPGPFQAHTLFILSAGFLSSVIRVILSFSMKSRYILKEEAVCTSETLITVCEESSVRTEKAIFVTADCVQ
jgi:hypothetical protein